MKKALTIAGSDSGGGAGIQADIKTFSALGVFGMSAITAVTAQNTLGVSMVEELSSDIIREQIKTVYEDLRPDVVKIGMVANAKAIRTIAEVLIKYCKEPIVLDPVMVSKSGHALLHKEAKAALVKELIPMATIVTPNLDEAGELIGLKVKSVSEMEMAARVIYKMGAKTVLIKGGHLDHDPIDLLYDGLTIRRLDGKRIVTKHTHGTGCTLSSAIAANLSKGLPLVEAVIQAKRYIEKAISKAPGIGKGAGPIHHFYQWYESGGKES